MLASLKAGDYAITTNPPGCCPRILGELVASVDSQPGNYVPSAGGEPMLSFDTTKFEGQERLFLAFRELVDAMATMRGHRG